MSDSSSASTGTQVDAVDEFLRDPSNKHDFHRALQSSARTPGDAGLDSFRVDRTQLDRSGSSGSFVLRAGSNPTHFSEFQPDGGYFLSNQFPYLEDFVHPTGAQQIQNGETLYQRALPNRDQAELGTILGEIVANPIRAVTVPGNAALKQVLRRESAARTNGFAERLRRARAVSEEAAKTAADDYLTYIFGAKPMVDGLDQLADSISRSRKSAAIVTREAGKRVRRSRSMPDKKRIASYTVSGNFGWSADSWMYADGTMHYFRESIQKSWWSGAFRYHAADTSSWLGKCENFFQVIDRATGIGFDAKVAWDLVPFSFMADWFANTGTFLENRTTVADYNIACEYGFTMNHTRSSSTAILTGILRDARFLLLDTCAVSSNYSLFQEVKQRKACSSYGFRTDFNKLNPYQWSALTAIGLSNVPGVAPRRRA